MIADLATTASLDRHAAAQAWAERQFPANGCLNENSRIEDLILATLRGAEERNASRC